MTLGAFLSGAVGMACLVVAAFFMRFWQKTRDRLFLFFALAFLILTSERILRLCMNLDNELAPYIYSVRLTAFIVIIAAIVEKNARRQSR